MCFLTLLITGEEAACGDRSDFLAASRGTWLILPFPL